MSEHNPWVTLAHPKTGGVFECPESSVAHWETRGWVRLADAEPSSDATKAELVAWAAEIDPENADAIAAMTKAELREQYGNSEA